ncbi:MAG TPA: VOC family protein [Dermatophilaceae bacterium]|nr:VOC family protein [Dermatophilaceae bacterium]
MTSRPGTVRLGMVVIDCPEPAALARFYGGLLGLTATDDDQDWTTLAGPGYRLAFQRAEPYHPPKWPDGPPQQFHLDLDVTDPVAAHELAMSLGATPLRPTTPPDPGQPAAFRVYADPVGHPFCLVRVSS